MDHVSSFCHYFLMQPALHVHNGWQYVWELAIRFCKLGNTCTRVHHHLFTCHNIYSTIHIVTHTHTHTHTQTHAQERNSKEASNRKRCKWQSCFLVFKAMCTLWWASKSCNGLNRLKPDELIKCRYLKLTVVDIWLNKVFIGHIFLESMRGWGLFNLHQIYWNIKSTYSVCTAAIVVHTCG